MTKDKKIVRPGIALILGILCIVGTCIWISTLTTEELWSTRSGTVVLALLGSLAMTTVPPLLFLIKDDIRSEQERQIIRLANIDRLRKNGFIVRHTDCAARPDIVNHVHLVQSTGNRCSNLVCWYMDTVSEIIEKDGVPTRNRLGAVCLACGEFIENPDAVYAGRLGQLLLGRDNILSVLDELDAVKGTSAGVYH